MCKRGCIVVIEDERDVLELLRDVLETEGFPVIAVPHPSKVRDSVSNVQPELFLVDMMLPGTSGVELAHQLRAEFADKPMIAMSASPLMLQVAAESKLFQDMLNKPFDLSVLLTHVERWVSAPEPCAH